jgi:hypothetical protein
MDSTRDPSSHATSALAAAAAVSPSASPGQELSRVEDELRAAALGLGVEPDIVEQPDLDDGRDIHADAHEQHIAEGVVAHLPANQVPGESEHDEEEKLGQL